MNLSRDKSMWRTRANKDLKKRKKKEKEEKKIGGDYDPLALKMKRVPRVVPPISFHLSRWTRPSSARGQHKFHRWNFHLIPFIWFSRKKWSGHCSPDPFILLRPLLPRSHLSRNWSNADSKKFSILLAASNSRNFASNFEDEDDKVESRLVRANEIQITWFARWTSGPGGGERGGRKSSMTR